MADQTKAKNLDAKHRRPTTFRRASDGAVMTSRFDTPALEPAPGWAEVPPRPRGHLEDAETEKIVAAIVTGWPQQPHKVRVNVAPVLDHLSQFPGTTWQERWLASGLDEGIPIRSLRTTGGDKLTSGLRLLFCLRILRPSLVGFRANKFSRYPETFRRFQDDARLEAFFAYTAGREDLGFKTRDKALFEVCVALTTQDITLDDLGPEALLHYSYECRRHGLVVGGKKDTTRFSGLMSWTLLHDFGHFPPGTPATLRNAVYRGQLSIEQLVDRYEIRHQSVRQMFIDYLTRRRAENDWSSVENLSRSLAGLFWAKVEQINPEQADFALDQHTYEQWRAGLNYRMDGQPRSDTYAVLMAIRGFYLDLQAWALHEPERWAAWAVPCPIPHRELNGHTVHRRRVKERVDDRTRVRQPLLPALLAYVEEHYQQVNDLRAEAATVGLGQRFTHNGTGYQRTNSVHDRTRQQHHGAAAVRAERLDTGDVIHLDVEEDKAFWEWAVISTLRHSGIRIEELVELSHLSIRHYQRPNGEVIALLVIAPSKTDRERVIPMSAELFHVIATILRRHTTGGRTVPMITRYDNQERVWSEPMPFLFQRRSGHQDVAMSKGGVAKLLNRACDGAAQANPDLDGVRFTPHDFRRLFATELVNNGLPIHIGAALLGHLNIQTTRGYVAVFDENVITHYQGFLDRRRSTRPNDEYKPVTREEWQEFDEHFDKRKVELGGCARPYGTPCNHEHACIRCPMLNINPKMLPRLDELETDLLERRQRAEAQNWLGEIDGIDLTLQFLRQKREQAQRLTRRPTNAVDLGMPLLTAPLR